MRLSLSEITHRLAPKKRRSPLFRGSIGDVKFTILEKLISKIDNFICILLYNRFGRVEIVRGTYHEEWYTSFTNCFTHLHSSFYIIPLVGALILAISIRNTVLVSIPEAKKVIIITYGEGIIKESEYNSLSKPLRAFSLALRRFKKQRTILLQCPVQSY